MKEVPLSRGLVALVDDEDFDLVSQYKWYAMGSEGAMERAGPAGEFAPRSIRRNVNKKDKLQGQLATLRNELYEIEHAERREMNVALIGKCFTFSNSYGSGDRWPLYVRVLSIGETGEIRVLQFQKATPLVGDGEIQIERNVSKGSSLGLDYREISLAGFDAAWKDLLSHIAGLHSVEEQKP